MYAVAQLVEHLERRRLWVEILLNIWICLYNALYVCVLCTGLRKKTVAPGAGGLDDHLRGSASTDLFGSADAIVKHVLEVSVCRPPSSVSVYTYTSTCIQ